MNSIAFCCKDWLKSWIKAATRGSREGGAVAAEKQPDVKSTMVSNHLHAHAHFSGAWFLQQSCTVHSASQQAHSFYRRIGYLVQG